MIYVYAKYQKPTPYIKRDITNVKVFYHAGRPACESMIVNPLRVSDALRHYRLIPNDALS